MSMKQQQQLQNQPTQPRANKHLKCCGLQPQPQIKSLKSPNTQSHKSIVALKPDTPKTHNNRYAKTRQSHQTIASQISGQENAGNLKDVTPRRKGHLKQCESQSSNLVYRTIDNAAAQEQLKEYGKFREEDMNRVRQSLMIQSTQSLSPHGQMLIEQLENQLQRLSENQHSYCGLQRSSGISKSNSPDMAKVLRDSINTQLGSGHRASKYENQTQLQSIQESVIKKPDSKSIISTCFALGLKQTLANIQPVQLHKNRRTREDRNKEKIIKEQSAIHMHQHPPKGSDQQYASTSSLAVPPSQLNNKLSTLMNDIKGIKKQGCMSTFSSPKSFALNTRRSVNTKSSLDLSSTQQSQRTSRINILEDAVSNFMTKKKSQKVFSLEELRSKVGIRYLSLKMIKEALLSFELSEDNDMQSTSVTKEIFVSYLYESILDKVEPLEHMRMVVQAGLKYIYKVVTQATSRSKISIGEAIIALIVIKFDTVTLAVLEDLFLFLFKSLIVNVSQTALILETILTLWLAFKPSSTIGKAIVNINVSISKLSEIISEQISFEENDRVSPASIFGWIINAHNRSKCKSPMIIKKMQVLTAPRSPLTMNRVNTTLGLVSQPSETFSSQYYNTCNTVSHFHEHLTPNKTEPYKEQQQLQPDNFSAQNFSPTRPFLPHKDLTHYVYFTKNLSNMKIQENLEFSDNHSRDVSIEDLKNRYNKVKSSCSTFRKTESQHQSQTPVTTKPTSGHKHTKSSQYSNWKKQCSEIELSTERHSTFQPSQQQTAFQMQQNGYRPQIQIYRNQTGGQPRDSCYQQHAHQQLLGLTGNSNIQQPKQHLVFAAVGDGASYCYNKLCESQQFSKDHYLSNDHTQFYTNNNITSSCLNCLLHNQSVLPAQDFNTTICLQQQQQHQQYFSQQQPQYVQCDTAMPMYQSTQQRRFTNMLNQVSESIELSDNAQLQKFQQHQQRGIMQGRQSTQHRAQIRGNKTPM